MFPHDILIEGIQVLNQIYCNSTEMKKYGSISLDESVMTQNDLSRNVKTSNQTTREHKEASKLPDQPSPSDSNGFTNNESTVPLMVNGEKTKPLKEGQASNGFTLQIDELNSMSQPELTDMLTEMVNF